MQSILNTMHMPINNQTDLQPYPHHVRTVHQSHPPSHQLTRNTGPQQRPAFVACTFYQSNTHPHAHTAVPPHRPAHTPPQHMNVSNTHPHTTHTQHRSSATHLHKIRMIPTPIHTPPTRNTVLSHAQLEHPHRSVSYYPLEDAALVALYSGGFERTSGPCLPVALTFSKYFTRAVVAGEAAVTAPDPGVCLCVYACASLCASKRLYVVTLCAVS